MSFDLKHIPQRPAGTPGLFRLVAAIFYDLFLLLAVLFIATAILLPFNSGMAFTAQQIAYPIFLLVVSFLFYGWFWTHGGQTLGLRAWHLKVLTFDQQTISWRQALIRFLTALLSWATCGLGFLWAIIDKNHYSWHDYLSKTTVFFDSGQK